MARAPTYLLARTPTPPLPPHAADMRAACSWLLEQQGPAQEVVEVYAWGPSGWQWQERRQLGLLPPLPQAATGVGA